MKDERDRELGTALGRLDVPAHREGFFECLWEGADEELSRARSSWTRSGRFAGLLSRRRRLGGRTLVVLLAGAVLVGCGTVYGARLIAERSGPPVGTIAFVEHDGASWDIYRIQSDGSELKRLTSNGASVGPAWSPDGRTIAYSRLDGAKKTVWTMNADGSGQRPVAEGAGPLAWSPDGTKILFAVWERRRFRLFTANADGSGQSPVPQAEGVGGAGGAFAWSPDGTRIVFTTEGQGCRRLLVVNVDGGGLRDLTAASSLEDLLVIDQMVWASDRTIFFGALSRGSWEICSIDAVSGALTVVATVPPATSFSLSPNARWLAVCVPGHGCSGAPAGEVGRLMRVPSSGQPAWVETAARGEVLVERLSRYVESGVASAWSPDGGQIAFAGATGGFICIPSPLYIVDVNGSRMTKVPHAGKVFDPVWQPR